MNKKLLYAISSGILLSTAISTPVLADTHKPADMTCEQFLMLDDVVRPKVVYWAEGFDKKGKPDEVIFDVEKTDNYYPVLVTECSKAPKDKLVSTMKKLNTEQHHR
jgi:hypothetical protein